LGFARGRFKSTGSRLGGPQPNFGGVPPEPRSALKAEFPKMKG